jgi:hypothetical protein
MKKVYRDLILILCVLAVGIVLLIIRNAGSKPGSFIVVDIDGKTVAEYPIEMEGRFTFNGGSNEIQISRGKVRMIHADCPDLVCVHQGWIDTQGQSIVCLPNRITVTVTGTGSGPLVDFVI